MGDCDFLLTTRWQREKEQMKKNENTTNTQNSIVEKNINQQEITVEQERETTNSFYKQRTEWKRLGIFYDGVYAFTVMKSMNIDCFVGKKRIKEFLESQINAQTQIITEEAFYGVSKDPRTKNIQDFYSGVSSFTAPLMRGKEKQIDTGLSIRVIKRAEELALDYVAIFTGDSDHIPMFEELFNKNIKTVLVHKAKNDENTGTSQRLKDRASICFGIDSQ